MTDAGASTTSLNDLLAGQPLFRNMTDACIATLLAAAETRTVDAGAVVITEGAPSDSVFVILDGELEVARQIGGGELPIAMRGRGAVVGEMGVVTGMPRNATIRARERSTLLAIPGEAFLHALRESPDALLAVLADMVGRLQAAEVDLVHNQKMASLGVLAAGLAHELNNPASALDRSAQHLREAVLAWDLAAQRIGARLTTDDHRALVDEARPGLIARAGASLWLDPLERSDREQQVQAWLRRHGASEPWRLAPALVEADTGPDALDRLAGRLPGDLVLPFVEWLATGQRVLRTLATIRLSAGAVSEIVAAVKAYTRLDQAPIQHVDLHESVDQALTILRPRLRSVRVIREYAEDMLELSAYAGELNQAWTNLIDNAADAMGGEGDLTIRTGIDGPSVAVEFIDTGPGIPPDVLPRIFDPFFTTKPPGKGTGLGLAITYSIIRRHGGTIHVASRPGSTRFTVRLPRAGVSA